MKAHICKLFSHVHAYLRNTVADPSRLPEFRERPDNGMLSAISSNQNYQRQPILQNMVDAGDGKCRTAIIEKKKRKCATGCNTKPKPCATGKPPRKTQCTTFKVDLECYSDVISIDRDKLRCIAEGKTELFNNELMTELSAWRANYDACLTQYIVNNFIGGYPQGGGFTGKIIEIPLLKKDGTINPYGMTKLRKILMDAGIGDKPMIVGGGYLWTYKELMKMACCNMGYDPTRAGMSNDFDYFYSNRVGQMLGDKDCFIVMPPGAIGNYYFNNNRGELAIQEGMNFLSEDILQEPFTGYPLDLTFEFRQCDRAWDFHFGINYGLFLPAKDGYEDCDPLSGVTDVFAFKAVCSDETICTGDVINECNCPPTASLTHTPLYCNTVMLDATSSAVGSSVEADAVCGTEILLYEWNIEGGIGRFQGSAGKNIKIDGCVCGTTDKPIVSFDECGTYLVKLRVLDDNHCFSEWTEYEITIDENCKDDSGKTGCNDTVKK